MMEKSPDFAARIRAGMEAYRNLQRTDGELAEVIAKADEATRWASEGLVGTRVVSRGRTVAPRRIEFHALGDDPRDGKATHEIARIEGSAYPLTVLRAGATMFCEDREDFEEALGDIFAQGTTAAALERLAGRQLHRFRERGKDGEISED